ncbi:hypothetical protein CKM354_000337400 [Cercospora kikuchii]|uniref:Cercosporin MFS transporter CTB4 n=1 Tax=Cercospora kikuchii TaxID=84275 RepID=A0A9P3CK70_9PEZI|nr:uncharacterized protein CKM354_000337400 [Cercospora kikuchii]GIZ40018.1 hypothetical protein CKM354_000337400 [Cercospora kikuchii]
MESLERVLSRPVAKPYRSGTVQNDIIHLNQDGHLDFCEGDVENPKNWSVARRWYITIVSIFLVISATFASSSPSGCLNSISEHFGVSVLASNLVTTLFLLGYCFGPLLWAPISERSGRRWVCYGTYICYSIFNFLCAFTNTFAGLLVGRFLTGTFASAALSNVPGVLADLWGPVERGNAMVVFSMMTFAGPALGPVVSGFLELKKDWRWAFYVLLWLTALTLGPLFTIPETLPEQVLVNKAKRIRKAKVPGYENVQAPKEASGDTLAQIFRVTLTRPWIILWDPISLLVAIYLSIVYALLYMLFTIYPIVFQEHRGWNSGVGALPLIGTMVGACIAGAIVFYESTFGKKKMLAGIPRKPEDRMPLAMIGGVLFPITMFAFAWSANFNSVHWVVPTIAGMFLSTAIVLIFVSYLSYLADTYLQYAASAIAANTVCRSAFGAVAPLFTKQMFDALGVGGAGSLIGGVALLLAPIPFLFWKHGERIRERSKFAPTEDDPEPQSRALKTQGSGSDEDRAGDRNLVDVEKQHQGAQSQDPYLDAAGQEKAERIDEKV